MEYLVLTRKAGLHTAVGPFPSVEAAHAYAKAHGLLGGWIIPLDKPSNG